MREQKIHGTPQGMNEQSNPGGLGQPRGQGGQQLPGHEISQTCPGQYTADQMTLGDVTDPSPGHHQPPGQDSLPGQTSRTDQPNPEDGQDGLADEDDMWQGEGMGT